MTAGVQADLELEGFAGLAVATEDKALQFGRPFQRHSSEPESGRQYAVYKTVHTQGQWAYREDYQMQYDAVEVPRRDAWMERGSRSLPDSGRASPCHRDGEWFIKLLQAEVEKMEGWCQQMEREAEDYDLPEESEWGRVPRAAPRCSHLEHLGGATWLREGREVGISVDVSGDPKWWSGALTEWWGGDARVPVGGMTVCFLPGTASPGEDPERRGQCSAPHVPEGAAVLPTLPAEHGECLNTILGCAEPAALWDDASTAGVLHVKCDPHGLPQCPHRIPTHSQCPPSKTWPASGTCCSSPLRMSA